MARVAILGQSGSGKSWFTGQKIGEILDPDDDDADQFEYAVHCDLEDEEQGLSLAEDPLLKTFECDKHLLRQLVVVNPENPPSYIPDEELADGPAMALPKWVLYRNKYVRVVPDGLDDAEQVILVEMMADAALKTGDCHFSLDEAHLVASTHKIGDKLSRLVTGGRKRGVEWVFISQRPAKLHEDILAQTNITVYFQLTSDRDLKKANDSAETFDAEAVLPNLGPRKAIVENHSAGQHVEIDTNDLERRYPHIAGDDGKSDAKWASGSDSDGSSDLDEVEMDAEPV
jgi:hypothetical protein